ncbi:curli major subunit CsgA [Buttiauxella noackiae]|uniref:curli major subunit CsgA n=1 Tax=Buttiauxella noackiae TaxID=82992 RepID=UPI0028D1AFDF|nr:curli major subunit CsgA [Buttiauxella noackiae]
MNFFKIAAIAAVVVSSSAMASDLQFGWPGNGNGNGNNSGPESTMKVYQHGANNNVTALQADARKSTVDIKQLGSSNGADVGQGADNASIDLLQKGYGNNATIDQWEAKGSTIDVSQYGVRNGAVVNQTAAASSVELTQAGYGNQANLQQH